MAAALAAAMLAMVGCSGSYTFDEHASGGSYSMAAQSGTKLPQAKEFSMMANAGVTADAATGRANVLLGNPPENTRDCRVTLILDATGEELYRTDVLAPGERVAYANLATEPFGGNPGTYPATALFEILDEQTGELIGTLEAGINITVE